MFLLSAVFFLLLEISRLLDLTQGPETLVESNSFLLSVGVGFTSVTEVTPATAAAVVRIVIVSYFKDI